MAIDPRIINGSIAGRNIAPFIALISAEAKCYPTSIYRGHDQAALLHAHGKSSQAELYTGFIDKRPGYLPANPPGFSSHEMMSDGVAYPNVPRGKPLPHWWMQGIDWPDTCVDKVIAAAKRHGWELFRAYPSGSEHHHLNFKREPKPGPRTRLAILRLRATLPKR